ncbi:MAG: hypothetical protein KAZ87_13855 [Spirochaetes bacterium]|nr:hypothetical protein [Spirochaetota bacterium]
MELGAMSTTTTVKKTMKKNRIKKKTNLLKLYSVMNKLTHDAVDKEVVKRFKILIDSSDEDFTKAEVDGIIKHNQNLDLTHYHEGLQPYIRHYVFMAKRKIK